MKSIYYDKLLRGFKRTASQCYFQTSNSFKDSTILAGSGRSGTTWLQEVINYDNYYRQMFEPFHPKKVKEVSDWPERLYIPEYSNDPCLKDAARKILSGDIRNYWVDKYNSSHIVKKRLIKDIRAQFFLKWLYMQFPGTPIVMIVRHPCAVVTSKMKLGWDSHLDDIFSQNSLVEDFLKPYKELVRTLNTPFEKHILQWCVENIVPLTQFSKGQLLVVYYEELCLNPEVVIKRVFSFLKREYSEKIWHEIDRPSALSKSFSSVNLEKSLIDSWKSSVTSRELDVCLNICKHFGLDKIYDSESFPRIPADEVLTHF